MLVCVGAGVNGGVGLILYSGTKGPTGDWDTWVKLSVVRSDTAAGVDLSNCVLEELPDGGGLVAAYRYHTGCNGPDITPGALLNDRGGSRLCSNFSIQTSRSTDLG